VSPSPQLLPVLADAHVHVHGCYPLPMFFDRAYTNLQEAARESGATGGFYGVLLLTEGAGEEAFTRFSGLAAAGAASDPGHGGWRFEPTAEDEAIVARNGGRSLVLVAGCQVAAAEGLEVLCIGTRARTSDGRPIRDVLAFAREHDALPVIPWGAGKWLFGRAALLDRLIDGASGAELFLGDESGRPFFWTTPRHFARGSARGIRNLPGTDPLPFPHEAGRAGSFGFRLDGPLDLARPASGMKALLRDPSREIATFGALEGALAFVRNQVGMQLRKRRGASHEAHSGA